MKSYYFRNVMNQITKKKFESGILFVIVFFMTFSLSLLHFFGYNDSIESNIGNSLDLSYEINNTHIISNAKLTELNNSDDPLEYFNEFVSFIEDIGTHEDLEYFNYNIHLPFRGQLDNEDKMFSYDAFGVSNENYLENNHIELLDGRFLTQEEIDQGARKVVVSDKQMTYKNGEYVNVEVGDKVYLNYFDQDSYEFEVIGIYKTENINFYFAQNDKFANSEGCLMSNKFIQDYVNKNPIAADFQNLYINRIQYDVKEYDHFIQFESYLKERIEDFDEEMEELGEPKSYMFVNSNNDSSILASVSRIKNIYLVIFICVFIIITIVLVSNVYYVLKKKTNEIGICYSLGESKLRITSRYVMAYMMLSIFAIVLGIIVGYYFSILLTDSMLNESIQLQANLARFTESFTLGEIESYTPEFTFTMKSTIYVVLEILGIIFVSVLGSMIIILNSKIFTRNGGWNA